MVRQQTQSAGRGHMGDIANVVSKYPFGYRNREDITNLPPGVLVYGSKNVLTNVSERVQLRKGYTLDGQASTTIAPILSSYDWQMHIGQERHLRAGNSLIQYRYVDSAGTVTWRTLMTSADSGINWAEYWDNTNFQDQLLFVNGSSNIYKWSGGVTTYASSTVNTITKQGTTTWAEENFSPTGSITILGVDYAYTGGTGTTTLTGVTPDPTGAGIVAGDVIHQKVVTTANSSTTGLPSAFKNRLIANLKNQIYIGDFLRRDVYVSKINSYTDYSFASPRLVGEGALLTLDGCPVAFISQDQNLYISAGKDQWYKTLLQTSSDLQNETLTIERLKTNSQQGALSQAAVSKMKNNVIMLNNETSFDTLGLVDNILGTPQTSNLSDPIKLDFDVYDFTEASVFYYRYFLYVAIPAEGVVRIYNLVTKSWEAPQMLPVSRFAVIDGELYGHSYNTPETFKLFSGTSDNGHPIPGVAVFSYQNYGSRTAKKSMNKFYVEGYIEQNTTLTLGITYEIDGCAQSTSYDIDGDDGEIVCFWDTDISSLGKAPLGTNPLGGTSAVANPNALPPKFRVFKTFPRTNFFEHQISFSSNGVDNGWELLAFGGNAEESTDLPVEITQ